MSLPRVVDRVLGMVTWAKVTASQAVAGKIGQIWAQGLSGNKLQHHQPYGFQARPKPGADALVVSMGSSASERIIIQAGDRRWTIALEEGEVAVVDDLGQKVHLTRTGIVINAPSIKLGTAATLAAARATDPVSAASSMAAWILAVSAHTGASLPSDFGTIASGSSKTAVE